MKNALARRQGMLCRAYALALVSVYFLFLPFGGYARMMEEKFALFLLLTVPLLPALPLSPAPRRTPLRVCVLLYWAVSALGALLSPYGSAVLLGGARRDGLLTLTLYAAIFLLLSRERWADRALLLCTVGSAVLCDALIFLQLMGCDPFRLYPEGLNYFDAGSAYLGSYAGCAGNSDSTALLLAVAVGVMAAAAVRGKGRWLAAPIALTLFALWLLRVAAAWVALFAALAAAPPMLLPKRRRLMHRLCLALCAAAAIALWRYDGGSETLRQAAEVLHGRIDGSFGSGRIALWRQILPLVREKPLLGGGCGTLPLRGLAPFYTYLDDGRVFAAEITSAHNEYLGILVDQGIGALGCYLTAIALALRKCWRGAANDRLAIAGTALLCYAAAAFFTVSSCITAPYLWLILAAIEAEKEQTA